MNANLVKVVGGPVPGSEIAIEADTRVVTVGVNVRNEHSRGSLGDSAHFRFQAATSVFSPLQIQRTSETARCRLQRWTTLQRFEGGRKVRRAETCFR